MKILELLKKADPEVEIKKDESGNYHIYNFEGALYDIGLKCIYDFGKYDKQNDSLFIDKMDMDRLNEYEVIISDEFITHATAARRPYYRMRGEKVTKEQAFEIIRRTDNYFKFDVSEIRYHKDYIGCENFDNWLIMKNHYPFGYGWIHTDGTVGGNAITQKYPDTLRYVGEWLCKLMEFPYLNLMIAVTHWNEVPDSFWSGEDDYWEIDEQEFLDAIEVGIYVHDKTVEIMNSKKATEKYVEYEALYGDLNRNKYESDYYQNNQIVQVDREYLKRCFESYGVNSEKYLDDMFGKDNGKR